MSSFVVFERYTRSELENWRISRTIARYERHHNQRQGAIHVHV